MTTDDAWNHREWGRLTTEQLQKINTLLTRAERALPEVTP